MGAGFARLNSLTIIQTSQGLAEFLLSGLPNTRTTGLVVGYDARHNSKHFAQLAAAVFESRGITVWWYEDIVPTPFVPFAVRMKKAAAGIMITASHNPAQDNGYKVYASNGCQINSPDDSLIAACIMENLEPTIWRLDGSPLRKPILGPMISRYCQSLVSQLMLAEVEKPKVDFVYTPMHGVGLRYMAVTIRATCLGAMTIVDRQGQPDPDFPTVKFPNPEETGALDLAMTTADEANIPLILANDPDADRFAVAEKVDGVWHQFTGDQVGVLLASWMVSSAVRPATRNDVLLTTAVSSQMLSYMGKIEGFSVHETLTGFKWLGNTAQALQRQGKRVLYAYEEALGYMFPNVVYDKDGIAAAMMFLRACRSWGSPWKKLQELYEKYGHFVTANTYWRSPSVKKTQMIFQSLRDLEQPFPTHISQRKVSRYRDLTTGYDSATKDNFPDLPVSASGQMITYWLEGTGADDGVRFTLRTSGTEPKIKGECSKKQYLVRKKLTAVV